MDVKVLLVEENESLMKSMKRLDEVATKILFVVRNNQLVATLTDGDIRRWILKKGDLSADVRSVANYSPKYLMQAQQHRAKDFMREQVIDALPIVNENHEILTIVFLNEKQSEKEHHLDLPVVIMAGGFGTRLHPYTKVLPKPLIPIGEIPIAEHIMDRFHRFGVNEFHLVVNHKKNMIKAYFNEIEKEYRIYYADEDIPLGTAGGLYLLKDKIRSPFILSNCDILIEEDYEKIARFHQEEKNFITMVCSLKNIQIPYGVVEISKNGEIESMKEKPKLSFFTNTGMYVVQPEVVWEMEGISIGFPEIIEQYQKKGKKIGVYPISEDQWMDMGQPEEMEKMRIRLEKELSSGTQF